MAARHRGRTTALGTLVPILCDAGILPTPSGPPSSDGVAGEFWPIVVISVFLTGVYGAAPRRSCSRLRRVSSAPQRARAARTTARHRCACSETVHTTGQAAVRLSVLIAALVLLARDVGFDFVLGAFAAGLVTGLALDSPEGKEVQIRLEGIGFGFVIPIYFVATGMTSTSTVC